MFNLRLKNLNVENFRGFGKVEVVFDPDLTVFISENGGGKTTVLDAVAENLRFFYHYAIIRQKYEAKLKETDVKNETLSATCKLVVEMEYPFTESIKPRLYEVKKSSVTDSVMEDTGTYHTDTTNQATHEGEENEEKEDVDDRPTSKGICEWKLNINKYGEVTPDFTTGNIAGTPGLEGYRMATSIVRDENQPVLVYYGRNAFNRPQTPSNAKIKNRIDAVYGNALEPERFSFNQLYHWYDEIQRKALQDKVLKMNEKQTQISALDLEIVNNQIESTRLEGLVNRFKVYLADTEQKIDKVKGYVQPDDAELDQLKITLTDCKDQLQTAEKTITEILGSIENLQKEKAAAEEELALVIKGKTLAKELDLINDAIIDMLNDDDKRYSNFRLDYAKGEFAIDKRTHEKTETITFTQMSSGEKALFAMVADLARRLIVANPQENNPLKTGTGIVLIDEIDQHLHPLWQSKVLVKLKEIFPKVQFVVSTHSPHILGEVHNHHIKVIDAAAIKSVEQYTFGKDITDILPIMNASTRNKQIETQLYHYSKLIAQEKWTEATALRKQLEKKIGKDELIFARADGIIKKKQLIER